jgi:hypothetical protein
MTQNFNYIRNRIAEHKKDDLLRFSYELLDKKKEEIYPIWSIFLLMKWTFIYGGGKYPSKPLTSIKYQKILNCIANFNQEHISDFIKKGQWKRAFQIIHTQQLYLQKLVYTDLFTTQLKLFSVLTGKYNVENSFKEKTGLSIVDFLLIAKIFWLYINIEQFKKPFLYFDGKFHGDLFEVANQLMGKEKIISFIHLLTLNPTNVVSSVDSFRHKVKKESLQTMEMSFFTMYPFQLFENNIRLVHPSIFNHTINYYLYDFLKSTDEKFTTEFGNRLEKYVALGLVEMGVDFKTENDLKKNLINSKLVDFFLPSDNIFIEVKASELQAYPSVNPTDELLFSSFRTSIFKAYFEQMRVVSKQLSPNEENYGIIITYKELFWSDFSELYPIGKKYYNDEPDEMYIPPENVFIIDIYTWDLIVQIVKEKKETLKNILRFAKKNNSDTNSYRQLFSMQIDEYRPLNLDLSYLQHESNRLDLESIV